MIALRRNAGDRRRRRWNESSHRNNEEPPAKDAAKNTRRPARADPAPVSVMPRGSSFKTVESIGRMLPDVEVTTTWGKPTLKVRGKMFVCIASHRSAEPNTLVVMMDFVDRDALIEDDPATYYLKDHYLNYPCVLVRLSRVRTDALRDLVSGAYRFVTAGRRKRSRTN